MDEKIFNRVEKKYLLTKNEQDAILKLAKKNMREDHYFKSKIFNIYFDTDNYDLIIQSIDHPVFKEKLRARSYAGYDKVFLEIKTKVRSLAYRHHILASDGFLHDDNHGYKRRILITHDDFKEFIERRASAEDLAGKSIEQASDLQIAREIDHLVRHFDLKPKILVYYNRESYVDSHGLRITFDTDIRFRNSSLNFTENSTDGTLLKSDRNIIMEVKAESAMPLWLVRQLSAKHLYPVQFSKIGKIYETIRKEKNV